MKHKIFFLSLSLLFCAPAADAQTAPALIITEIMYDLPESDSGREWVEIYNIGSESIEVATGTSGWRFFDGGMHTLKLLQGSPVLAPEQAAIIVDNPDAWFIDYSGFAGTVFDSSFSLKNTSSTIGLSYASSEPLFTSVLYDASWGAAGNGMTLERSTASSTAEESSLWVESSLIGGTPGSWLPYETTTPTTTLPLEPPSEAPTSTPPETPAVSPPQPQQSAPPQPPFSRDLLIHEILPNPSGSDGAGEWIELYNAGTSPVDLAGWTVQDNSSTVYSISEEGFATTDVSPGGYFVIPREKSGIALNNTGGDTVRLYWPDTNIADVAVYLETAPEGQSWATFSGGWEWAEPTKGAENRRLEPAASSAAEGEEKDESVPSARPVAPLQDGALIITELLPNPDGDDSGEWIEIKNTTTSTIDLSGWQLDDAAGGSKPYLFIENTMIEHDAYIIVAKQQSKLTLNNNEDSVRLLDPSGHVRHVVEYEDAPSGSSYAFDEHANEWFWSPEPTQGAAAFRPYESGEREAAALDEVITVDFDALDELPEGTLVQVQGIVALPPGVVASRKWFITNTMNAVQEPMVVSVYQRSGLVPDLEAGQVITLRGSITSGADTLQFTVKDTSDIGITGSGSVPRGPFTLLNELDHYADASLVTVEGDLTRINTKSFTVTDGDAKILIRPGKDLTVRSWKLAKGDRIRANGLLLFRGVNPELYIQRFEDLNIVTSPVVKGFATSSDAMPDERVVDTDVQHNGVRWYYLMTVPGAFFAGWAVKRYLLPRVQ